MTNQHNDQSKNQSGQQNQPKSGQQAKQQQGQQAQQDSKPSKGQDATRSSNPDKSNLNKDQNNKRYTACSSVRSPAQAGLFFIAGLSGWGTPLPSGPCKDYAAGEAPH